MKTTNNLDKNVGSWGICKNKSNIMRKIILSLAGLLAFGSMIAQPVADNAIIPVSVTLNSILRLNVTSGGNIEFVVNTLKQYEEGIENSARYTTTFTVASSIDFKVEMYSENDKLASSTGGGEVDLENLGYVIESIGTADVGVGPDDAYQLLGADVNPTTPAKAITNSAVEIVTSYTGHGAGDITKNMFEVQWRFGTGVAESAPTMNSETLLQQSIPADRYTTNIFLVLSSL